MAQIAIAKLADGPRNAIYHVTIVGDGSGDLDDEIIIDPAADFDPTGEAIPALNIQRLHYDLSGFSAWLEFDYLATDTPVWSMSSDGGGMAFFDYFGGLTDRSGMDGTGKLKMSTNGLDAGDRGTIIIEAKKS